MFKEWQKEDCLKEHWSGCRNKRQHEEDRKKNWMKGIRKTMNERNLSEGQWEDTKKWSIGFGQRRKTFWTRHTYIRYLGGSSAYTVIWKRQSTLRLQAVTLNVICGKWDMVSCSPQLTTTTRVVICTCSCIVTEEKVSAHVLLSECCSRPSPGIRQ
jgi:hypothetical protein